MLNDTITLLVDEDGAGAGAAVSRSWTRYRTQANSSLFVGAGDEPDTPRALRFIRSEKKRSGDINGFNRTSVKFSSTVSVPNAAGDGNVSLPMSCELKFAIPEGATAAETLSLRETLFVFLNSGNGYAAKVVDDLEV
jgi:hypothetical protein